MSKNSKNSKRLASAREMSKRRQNGSGGSATTGTTKKKNAWWQKFRSYGEFVKGGKKPPRREQEAAPDALVAISIPT